jgi:hypothetical protein
MVQWRPAGGIIIFLEGPAPRAGPARGQKIPPLVECSVPERKWLCLGNRRGLSPTLSRDGIELRP